MSSIKAVSKVECNTGLRTAEANTGYGEAEYILGMVKQNTYRVGTLDGLHSLELFLVLTRADTRLG